VAGLLARLGELERTVAQQREEVARLKGLKGRLDVKRISMDRATEPVKPDGQEAHPGRGKLQ
jgi:hypothetical protein